MGMVNCLLDIFLDNPLPTTGQLLAVRVLARLILTALDLPVSLDSLFEILSLHILLFHGEPLPPSIFAPLSQAITMAFHIRYT